MRTEESNRDCEDAAHTAPLSGFLSAAVTGTLATLPWGTRTGVGLLFVISVTMWRIAQSGVEEEDLFPDELS